MYLIIIALAVVGGGVVLYNRLIRARNRVDTAWSDVDVQLQRRHDLIPRLVKSVDAYAGYEKATLEAVAALRAEAMRQTGVDSRGRAEEKLGAGVHKLIALAENYPDLKASKNFLDLQNQLVETENYLQFARRYYNGSVREYNTMIATVPGNVVAGIFGFRRRDYFQKSSDDAATVPLVEFGSLE